MSKKHINDFLVANKEGVCITSEGLDTIWPKGNGPSLLLDGKVPFNLPPTCIPGTPKFEDQVGTEVLYDFVFNGKKHPQGNDLSAVPLPDALGFMIGIVATFILVSLWRNCDDFENIR